MALTSVNPTSAAPPKASALENAAKVLGIVGSVASTVGNFAGHAGTPATAPQTPTSNLDIGQSPAIAGAGGASVGAQIPSADPLMGKPAGFQAPTKPQPQFGNFMGMR